MNKLSGLEVRLLGKGGGQGKGRCTKIVFKYLKRSYMAEGFNLFWVIPGNSYKVNFGGDWWEGGFCLGKRKDFLTNRVI